MKTSFVEIDKNSNGEYLRLLSIVSKLSGLFSDKENLYIDYRLVENIFCRSFSALNISRSDTAYDANYLSIGVGLKTFSIGKNGSTEKIAEFTKLSEYLRKFTGKGLALKLAEYRNARIELANNLYNISDACYHIVARTPKELIIFETDYSPIDINNIYSVKEKDKSITFEDGKNYYSYKFSKSTLYRRFIVPKNAYRLPVEVMEDPFQFLLDLFSNDQKILTPTKRLLKGIEYVILPLYGIKENQKFVFEKSGLNQWNAAGRARDFGEVYIPIPREIHKNYPHFFPKRDEEFNLAIPTGQQFRAKVCQDSSKALMTNPNNALADWLLRKLLKLKEGQLATIEKLEELGFDSVIIYKDGQRNYRIDKAKSDSYEDFIQI